MSKYDELTRLGVDHSRRFHEAGDRCRFFATRLFSGLADWLEAPIGEMNYLEVGPDLELGGRLSAVRRSLPELTYGEDGFWYLGVSFRFASPEGSTYFDEYRGLFGLQPAEGGFAVRHKSKDIFIADEKALAEEFYVSVFHYIKGYYESAIKGPTGIAGFEPGQDPVGLEPEKD